MFRVKRNIKFSQARGIARNASIREVPALTARVHHRP